MGAPAELGVWLAAVLFLVGLIGVLIRRNLIFILIAVEVMLNAGGLLFVAGGARWAQPEGQSMFLFILALAASEVAIGLALIIQIHRRNRTVDGDSASKMKG